MPDNILAYGFINLENQLTQRVTQVSVPTIFTAVQESAAEHNRQLTGLLASLVELTTEYKEHFALPVSGTLQPLDENGVPLPVKFGPGYDVAYPIQGGGFAWGTNRVTRAKMTVQEANTMTISALMADVDWMRRHMLAALFYPTAWTFKDQEHGDLTIQPLANADTVLYPRVGGASATDTHYLAQAAVIADAANPFPTIYAELKEHPSNAGDVVVYVPTNLVASITGLTDFVPVRDPSVIPAAADAQLVASIDRGFGDEVLGKVNKCWIVEWRALPDNYMIAHCQGSPVLKMREHKEGDLQGLNPENFSPNGNYLQTSMIRYAGFGVVNRVAALVYRIGDAAYAAPTGYTAMPLPV
jgi:hypothetical protein